MHEGEWISERRSAASNPGRRTEATWWGTTTQQVGITIGIPLLDVLATTQNSLFGGARTVLGIDAAIVIGTALLVAAGLRRGPALRPGRA